MSFFSTAEHEKEKLQYFASPEGRDDLYQYNQKESRTVLEVRMFALKIFLSVNKFHAIHALVCRTILAIICLFCPSVAFHVLEVTCGFVVFFRCWRIFLQFKCLLNGWCN
jgi:hypothetical protein